MQNKLLTFIRKQNMIAPGDHIICALSGGADSVALTFAMYLLKDKLDIRLSAAHFNHHLRGAESDRDEAFARDFCDRYEIPLFVGEGRVKPGKKGLEAAARDARYGFLRSLDGKIATAHTADDNAETVLLHLVRGTGLKGLGGIAPVNGNVIRPMLTVTRQDVERFCQEWCLSYIQDSSNDTDAFLRNRLRHKVMPILKEENPRLAENVSAMALRLRQDEDFLNQSAAHTADVEVLKAMHPAQRSRALEQLLKENGVREPEGIHIAQAEALLYSHKPSACIRFPGGITVARQYGRLVKLEDTAPAESVILPCPGSIHWNGFTVTAAPAEEIRNTADTFTVLPAGELVLRGREAGDAITLPGGTKSLKKLFIDRKIPASERLQIPVLADEAGILGVYSIGADTKRKAGALPAVQIRFEPKET